jgi:hypothetical protein
MISGAQVQSRLGLTDAVIDRITMFGRADMVPTLPADEAADAYLRMFHVGEQDRAETLSARPDPALHPELWWVLTHLVDEMLQNMDRPIPVTGFPAWPALPLPDDPVGCYLYVWVLLAVADVLLEVYQRREIPGDIADSSLVLGKVLDFHRDFTGHGGMSLFQPWSPPVTFRAADYHIGAHSFTRCDLAFGAGAQGHGLFVHVPHGRSLNVGATREAMAQAEHFMSRHYPEEPLAMFACSSWLLDPQWADYLPESSNILEFQRQFRLIPEHFGSQDDAGDKDVLFTALGQHPPDGPLDEDFLSQLPQDTSLERGFAHHIRSGGHFHSRVGVRPIGPAGSWPAQSPPR